MAATAAEATAAATATATPLGRVQVMDATEGVTTTNGCETEILVFGRNMDGESVCVRVRDTPWTVYMRVPDSWTAENSARDLVRVREAMDRDLVAGVRQRHKWGCRRTHCPRCGVTAPAAWDGERTYSMCTEPCREDSVLSSVAVLAADLVHRKSLVEYASRASPFVRFGLSAAFYVPAAAKWVQSYVAGSGPEWAACEVHGVVPDAVMGFLYASVQLDAAEGRRGAGGVGALAWLRFPLDGAVAAGAADRKSICDLEYVAAFSALSVDAACTDTAPVRVLAFDLETSGLLPPKLKARVDAARAARAKAADRAARAAGIGPIYCFSAVGRTFFATPSTRVVVGDVDAVHVWFPRDEGAGLEGLVRTEVGEVTGRDGRRVRVVVHPDERALLLAWTDVVRDFGTDVLTGYNINKFDVPYASVRARALGVYARHSLWTKVLNHQASHVDLERYSKAKGDNDIVGFDAGGVVVVDMFLVVQLLEQLAQYGLGYVAETLLGHTKGDLPHELITPYWRGTAVQRTELADYNYIDSALVIDLFAKENVMNRLGSEARVSGVLLRHQVFVGVQQRNCRLLHGFLHAAGYLMPLHTRRRVDPLGADGLPLPLYDDETAEDRERQFVPAYEGMAMPIESDAEDGGDGEGDSSSSSSDGSDDDGDEDEKPKAAPKPKPKAAAKAKPKAAAKAKGKNAVAFAESDPLQTRLLSFSRSASAASSAGASTTTSTRSISLASGKRARDGDGGDTAQRPPNKKPKTKPLYKGGYVLKGRPGFYTNKTLCVDFASVRLRLRSLRTPRVCVARPD